MTVSVSVCVCIYISSEFVVKQHKMQTNLTAIKIFLFSKTKILTLYIVFKGVHFSFSFRTLIHTLCTRPPQLGNQIHFDIFTFCG